MQAGSPRSVLGAVVTLAVCAGLAACSPVSTDIAVGQVHAVTLSSHALTDTSCQPVPLRATMDADASVVPGLIWFSSDSNVALPDSLGHVLALAPGSALLRVSSFADTTKFDTARVTVVDPTGPFVTVTGVDQSATGQPATLSALHDSVDVILNVVAPGCRRASSPQWVKADVIFAGQDTVTQSFSLTGGIAGAVLLRVNTAQKDSTTGVVRFPNGNYTIAGRVTDKNGVVVNSPSALQATIANP